jgi:hypothetical protein
MFNFENSYLFEYLSKIHEINSVGFLFSCSIHEKYKTQAVAFESNEFKLILELNSFIK